MAIIHFGNELGMQCTKAAHQSPVFHPLAFDFRSFRLSGHQVDYMREREKERERERQRERERERERESIDITFFS